MGYLLAGVWTVANDLNGILRLHRVRFQDGGAWQVLVSSQLVSCHCLAV